MISSSSKWPLRIAQVFAAILSVFSFFCVISFLASVGPEDAILKHHKPLPSGWEAGVWNHDHHYEWWLASHHPGLFILSCFVLLAAVGFLLVSVKRSSKF
jgi:hypothetical protein